MNLKELPRIQKRRAFEYQERVRIERVDGEVVAKNTDGDRRLNPLQIACLMLGPGVSITHAAVALVTKSGCSIVWCGEDGGRVYASSNGGSRSCKNAMLQAKKWADPKSNIEVVKKLYSKRFKEPLSGILSVNQIRGLEGVRVRESYKEWSRLTGVQWHGRVDHDDDWNRGDVVNRALSVGNSCLYGVCHAALLSCGFLPALGFIHTDQILSFVYDVADLYKHRTTIPLAFKVAAEGPDNVETRARKSFLSHAKKTRLLNEIVPDVYDALSI